MEAYKNGQKVSKSEIVSKVSSNVGETSKFKSEEIIDSDAEI